MKIVITKYFSSGNYFAANKCTPVDPKYGTVSEAVKDTPKGKALYIKITCDPDFLPKKGVDLTAVCQPDGKWSPEGWPPTCERKFFHQPNAIQIVVRA